MPLLLILLLLLLIFAGAGFAFHLLWVIAFIALVVLLINAAVRRGSRR